MDLPGAGSYDPKKGLGEIAERIRNRISSSFKVPIQKKKVKVNLYDPHAEVNE
jgi:hypothetical protein